MSYQYNGPVQTGSFTVAAVPAVVNIALGYVPAYVRVICKSGVNVGKSMTWNDQMTDGTALLASTDAFEPVNGITKIPVNNASTSTTPPYNSLPAGFKIGVQAIVTDEPGDVIIWEAIRSAKQ